MPAEPVDEKFIVELAKQSLPKDTDFADYIEFSRQTLAQLAAQVLTASGLNFDQMANFAAWRNAMEAAEKELNKKNIPTPPAENPTTWPPLPGTGADVGCSSTFDVNDLALRGR